MTLHPRVHPEAEAEFFDAVRYYQTREAGLGDAFDAEIARAVDDALWNPDAWPKLPGWDRLPVTRSRKVDVFPYRVIYFVRDNEAGDRCLRAPEPPLRLLEAPHRGLMPGRPRQLSASAR